MSDMTYITRKGDRDAWMVRVIFYTINVRCSRSFSDATHGGKDESLRAAMEFRDAFVAQWSHLADWQTEQNRNDAMRRRMAQTVGEAKRLLVDAERKERRERNAVHVEAARADVQRVLTTYGVQR